MSVNLQDDRWSVSGADFAVRVIIPDLKGFFDKMPLVAKLRSLVIEPGTRAMLVDNGALVGEVPPGEYTLESFIERLQFWREKQATIFLTRCEDVPIDGDTQSVPCLDGVCFDVSYRWTTQIADILPFMENLMGAKDALSIEELKTLLERRLQIPKGDMNLIFGNDILLANESLGSGFGVGVWSF